MSDNVEVILPIMFTPLYENSKGHWNRLVGERTVRVVIGDITDRLQDDTYHGVQRDEAVHGGQLTAF